MSENCHVEPLQKNPSKAEMSDQATAHLAISGMGCPNCAARVRNSVLSLVGVIRADVSHETGAGVVIYNPGLVDGQTLVEAVSRAGNDGRHAYGAKLIN